MNRHTTAAAPAPQGQRRVLVELRVPRAADPRFAHAAAEAAALPSLVIDRDYAPVAMPTTAEHAAGVARDAHEVVVVRATVDDGDLDALRARPDVVAVYDDAPIQPFVIEAAVETSTPTLADVARGIGAADVWAGGNRGAGTVIGIVDGGITAIGRPARRGETSRVGRVVGGWPEDSWGTTAAAWGEHGNMTSTDALGIAPEAELLDIRISDERGGGAVSNALQGFDWALRRFRSTGRPQILSNSWGIYQEAWDPVYARNSDHPFTRKVVEAIDAGMIVLFAAGNCGDGSPDRRCGTDCGPALSIWGANGHPRVITVGAATLTGAWLGYSSQGPAALDASKPDVCAPSQFRGYAPLDTGTSAACPVAAGAVALLKAARPDLTQDAVRETLRGTARDIDRAGWDPRSGAGMLDAFAAMNATRPLAPQWATRRVGSESWCRGVAALPRDDGGIDAYGVGVDSRLRHVSFDGSSWAPATPLDGVLVSAPAAVAHPGGAIDVLAIGDSSGIWRKRHDTRAWTAWTQLCPGRWLYGVSAVVRPDDGLDVFAVGTDSRVYRLSCPGDRPVVEFTLDGICLSAPVAMAMPDGRVEVVVIGPGNALYSKVGSADRWGRWRKIGRGRALHGVALAASPGGERHLVAIGTDGAAYHALRDGDAWGPFERVDGATAVAAPGVATARERLDVLVLGDDGGLHHAHRVGLNHTTTTEDHR